ncbi:hypothetical protein, partial [Oceanispirochaeta sp.]|uniref:hypothetical protein n=1 Tax=Oceanispirochaeta sp. TaxID=2035350 RepID=UPI00263068EF
MNKIIVLISMAIALLFMGCDTSVESTEGTDYLLAGYYMMAGEETAIVEEGVSRTTAPAWWDKYSDYTYANVIAMGTDGLKVQNYPEQGQVTYITVTTADATEEVYKVSSRTEYPQKDDLIDYYQEVYYLWDKYSSDLWKDGAIVEKINNVWIENSKARETMEVVFKDGSIRKEWIAYDTNALDPTITKAGYYAQFSLDGDMVIPSDTA